MLGFACMCHQTLKSVRAGIFAAVLYRLDDASRIIIRRLAVFISLFPSVDEWTRDASGSAVADPETRSARPL